VGGLWVEKKIEEGVMGKMTFFLLRTEQRGESTRRPAGGGGKGADDPGHGDGR
jgi:hypothetical protein